MVTTDMEGRENEIQTERQRAWELRCQGLSYPKIAGALGVSLGKAWNLIQRTEHEAHALLAERAAQAKCEHLGQLEAVKEQAVLSFQATGKPQFLSVIVKTIELERKVLRLDDERQAYLDAKFFERERRWKQECQETARQLTESIANCAYADDEARHQHLAHNTPFGEMCRELEAQKIEAGASENGAEWVAREARRAYEATDDPRFLKLMLEAEKRTPDAIAGPTLADLEGVT